MPKNLPLSLFIMRLTLAVFLAPWVADKFTAKGTAHTARIFENIYKIKGFSTTSYYAVGVLWVILLIAFVTGFKKRLSYGLVMVFHGIGTVMTIPYLVPWSDQYNMLFLAAIPVLGAMIALYMLRGNDTYLSIST